MNQEKEIPKTYYEKILVSSGEAPEEPRHRHLAVVYDTDKGPLAYEGKSESEHGWYCNNYDKYPKVLWWYKPVPSPKQEALDFAEWCDDCYFRIGKSNIWTSDLNYENIYRLTFTTSELYDKFKEKGE